MISLIAIYAKKNYLLMISINFMEICAKNAEITIILSEPWN